MTSRIIILTLLNPIRNPNPTYPNRSTPYYDG